MKDYIICVMLKTETETDRQQLTTNAKNQTLNAKNQPIQTTHQTFKTAQAKPPKTEQATQVKTTQNHPQKQTDR